MINQMDGDMNTQKNVGKKIYDIALVIGRFQPFCRNHLLLLEHASSFANTVAIGIGVPNYDKAKLNLSESEYEKYQLKYILPYERVKNSIDCKLGDIPHMIFPVRDILDPLNYGKQVFNSAKIAGIDLSTNKKTLLLGENEFTYKCFANLPLDVLVAQNVCNFHATDVRRELLEYGKSDNLVANLTADEIKLYGNAQRKLNEMGEK